MAENRILDGMFAEAVAAMDAGDTMELTRLLDLHPGLVSQRLDDAGQWLRDKVGNALDTFFARPYLLWFVAEDPVRNGILPSNAGDIAHTIVIALDGVVSKQEQIDYALRLVAWSKVARDCGVQIELIDVLAGAGASFANTPEDALVNGNLDAAAHLIGIGAPLTFQSALCLGRFDDVDRLADAATIEQKQDALTLAALNRNSAGIQKLLDLGVAPTSKSKNVFPHATALHHAVSSGSLESVRILVESGADTTVKDTAWGATPAGWAEYCKQDEIAEYLRTHEPNAR